MKIVIETEIPDSIYYRIYVCNGTPIPTDTDLNDVEPIGLYEGKEQRNE